MVQIDHSLTPAGLLPAVRRLWELSGRKISDIERTYRADAGAPVFTCRGRYTSRGWTDWTQGFQYGSAILQFDATDDPEFLAIGRDRTLSRMAPHVTHFGVHDHGFNNVSTYGNLLRLARRGRIEASTWEVAFYQLALKCSGAVQARRWTKTSDGGGFIYSFNGPHSLFADTIRSLRSLALAHSLGHDLLEENDTRTPMLERLFQHARATAHWSVYYGEGRDAYDVCGRVAHESIFNVNDGRYRCPSTQQGYSPFTTWTRALAWVICGFAEELEFVDALGDDDLAPYGGRSDIEAHMTRAAAAAADYFISSSARDGVPYWDTGAPGLALLGDWWDRPAEPFNDHEPVDSSAALIASQGLLRLGSVLSKHDDPRATTYRQAGLTVARTLFDEPYLSTDPTHQGLILHSVYHRPNGWDYVPPGRKIPCGESSMWGDYHSRELALMIQRLAEGAPTPTFFG